MQANPDTKCTYKAINTSIKKREKKNSIIKSIAAISLNRGEKENREDRRERKETPKKVNNFSTKI